VNKDVKRLVRQLRREGYTVVISHHVLVYRDGQIVGCFSKNLSKAGRAMQNVMAELHRDGILPR
jgi:hypothetical protein